jgi:hypothetical protein
VLAMEEECNDEWECESLGLEVIVDRAVWNDSLTEEGSMLIQTRKRLLCYIMPSRGCKITASDALLEIIATCGPH